MSKHRMILKNLNISEGWSLFLDRDGVINVRLVNDYVKKWDDFRFIDGVLDAMKVFNSAFENIVVVSNQQGVGKGLMKIEDVVEVHKNMVSKINESSGRIDKVYFCPELKENHPFCRKPSVGMALKAKHDFPAIHFKKSIMAGDSLSDMQFGKRLKMKTVLISEDNYIARKYPQMVDYCFKSLNEIANRLWK
jgi:histidinol-phosphate phosphatase family protein